MITFKPFAWRGYDKDLDAVTTISEARTTTSYRNANSTFWVIVWRDRSVAQGEAASPKAAKAAVRRQLEKQRTLERRGRHG